MQAGRRHCPQRRGRAPGAPCGTGRFAGGGLDLRRAGSGAILALDRQQVEFSVRIVLQLFSQGIYPEFRWVKPLDDRLFVSFVYHYGVRYSVSFHPGAHVDGRAVYVGLARRVSDVPDRPERNGHFCAHAAAVLPEIADRLDRTACGIPGVAKPTMSPSPSSLTIVPTFRLMIARHIALWRIMRGTATCRSFFIFVESGRSKDAIAPARGFGGPA